MASFQIQLPISAVALSELWFEAVSWRLIIMFQILTIPEKNQIIVNGRVIRVISISLNLTSLMTINTHLICPLFYRGSWDCDNLPNITEFVSGQARTGTPAPSRNSVQCFATTW